jgi:hypothetical protein
MSRRLIRPLAATACFLTIAAAGIALQPDGGRPPREQPAGERGGQPGERGERGPGGPGGPGGRQQVSVEGSMKGMNRALRQLARQVGDESKKAENLRLINDMQRACVNAKSAPLPDDVLEHAKDEAGKAKMAAEFREDLIKVMHKLLDIETDIAAGKLDDAKAKLAEVGKMRDHGHEEMGLKDEDEKDERR